MWSEKLKDWEHWETQCCQSSSLHHPVSVSRAEPVSRSSFQRELPPHWVRHRFQRIQMCSLAHKAFLWVGCEKQPHILASVCACECFGRQTADLVQLGGVQSKMY